MFTKDLFYIKIVKKEKRNSMIKNTERGNLIIISGPTCAGKATVIKRLLEIRKNTVCPISYTSRAMRLGEKEGVDYYFVSREEFERKIEHGDFLEYAKVRYGEYFGTPKKELEDILASGKDVVLEIDVQGAKQVKSLFPETILIFILAPSMDELKRRIKERGAEKNINQIIDRFQTAYREINELQKYNYVVVNDEVENAVEKINAILISEKCRVDRIEEVYVKSEEEFMHELLMDKDFVNEDIKIDG